MPPSKAGFSAAEPAPAIISPTPIPAVAATNSRRLIVRSILTPPKLEISLTAADRYGPVGTAIMSTVIVRWACPTPCTITFDAAGGRAGS